MEHPVAQSKAQVTTKLSVLLLSSAVLLSCLSWSLEAGLKEKGATFFLFRKVT